MRLYHMDRPIVPLVRRVVWDCLCCDFVASAMTDAALKAAMDDHAEYVNRTANRATDPHFHELRMVQLLQS